MHKRLIVLKDIVKTLLLIQSPFLIFLLCYYIIQWRNYCEFDYSDFSQEQVFECKPGSSNVYQTRIFVEGEVTDTIQLLVYYHTDFKHTGIPGTSFLVSRKFTGELDTMISFQWYSGVKLFGVIKPSSTTEGHLNLGCYFRTEWM